jgi:ATP:ADP antiporter, AAA family
MAYGSGTKVDANDHDGHAPVWAALCCSAVVSAQFIAGKATRDAIFLAHFDVAALPVMIAATAGFSVLLVTVNSRMLRRVAPATLVPLAAVTTGVVLLACWASVRVVPRIVAPVIYLQVSGVGPMLGSAFWLIASERFDPRTAKQRFGQIAAAGTLGGLVGGVVAERVAALAGIYAMLPVLATLSFAAAWQLRQLSGRITVQVGRDVQAEPDLAAETSRTGLRLVTQTPYLRDLALLMLLGTTAAALIDFLLKADAVSTYGRGDGLLRFFAVYYAAASLATFAMQTAFSRTALQKFGLSFTTASPALALITGACGSIFASGLPGLALTRGAESVFRGSLFRAGYELLYTPLPVAEKRSVKSIIDVAFDRCGDALGGGFIRFVLLVAPQSSRLTLLLTAIGCSATSALIATRVGRGYIKTLERNLLDRSEQLNLSDVAGLAAGRTGFDTLTVPAVGTHDVATGHVAYASSHVGAEGGADLPADVQQIVALRSRDPERVRRVLQAHPPLPGVLIKDIVALLGWDAVSSAAIAALNRIAEEHVGELTDALLKAGTEPVMRRRLARVFSACNTQRAVDGLLFALDDARFEVRFQCARSLTTILARNPGLRVDRDRVLRLVMREATVSQSIWESRRNEALQDDSEQPFQIDALLKDRASRSLAHVFALLTLILPAEPLQVAFRGLHTTDRALRGTALEYLDGILPPPIRETLWPYLDMQSSHERKPARDRATVLSELMRAHPSIVVNLKETTTSKFGGG